MLNRLLATGDKATTDRSDFVKATFTEFSGAGILGSIPRSRTHPALFQRWSGWIYAAVMINARGIAGLPLRLYTSNPDNNGSKSIDHARRAYLSGKMLDRPSKSVLMRSANGNADVEEVTSHPILDLLQQPNPLMSGYDASTLRSINLQVTGNSYLHIVENAFGFPAELWPMASSLVEIIPDSTGQIIAGYAYGRTNDRVEFAFDEVAHQRIVNPLDPFYGRGWVDAALTSADILDAMDEYELALFDNHARPDWAILVKEQMSDQEYARLEKQIDKKLRGRKRSGRPMVFEGGIDAKPLQFAPRDLAFSEGANRMVEKIAAISGVPVTKLKANDPNRANAESGALDWLRGTGLPYAILDEEYLNNDIVSRFDPTGDLFLAYDNPVPEDAAAKSIQAVADIQAGIRTRNEVRSEMGLPPVDGGDELLIAAGMIPISDAGETPFAFPSFMGSRAETQPEDKPEVLETKPVEENPDAVVATQALNGAQVMSAIEIVKLVKDGQLPRESAVGQLQVFFNLNRDQADMILASVGEGFIPEPPAEEPVETEKVLDSPPDCPKSDGSCGADCYCHGEKVLDWFEFYTVKNLGLKAPSKNPDFDARMQPYDSAINSFIDQMSDAFKSEIDALLASGLDVESTVGTQDQEQKYAELLRSLYTTVMDLAGSEAVSELPGPDISWSIEQPDVVAFIDRHTVELAGEINKSTRVALRNMLGTGIEEGETIDQLTSRVQEWATTEGDDDRSVKWRARRIARTETARAHGEGRREGWIQSSVVSGRKWIASGIAGAAACQFCQAMDQKVIPVEGSFVQANGIVSGTGGGVMKVNRAVRAEPLHPNCRCHTDAVLIDE